MLTVSTLKVPAACTAVVLAAATVSALALAANPSTRANPANPANPASPAPSRVAQPVRLADEQPILDRKLPEVRFDSVAADDAISFLQDASGATITVEWDKIKVSKTAVVKTKLSGVTLRQALSSVLSNAGAKGELRITADGRRVAVTAEEKQDKQDKKQKQDKQEKQPGK